jgi:hypothetical protein
MKNFFKKGIKFEPGGPKENFRWARWPVSRPETHYGKKQVTITYFTWPGKFLFPGNSNKILIIELIKFKQEKLIFDSFNRFHSIYDQLSIK